MRSGRNVAVCLAALASLVSQADGQELSAAYQRGLELEQKDRYREAAAAYRDALREAPASIPALLGLERAYAQMGWSDSLLPIVRVAIAARPREQSLRTVELRTLRATGDSDGLREAFERWRRDVPRDPAPYRELARVLLQDGRTIAADSVLRRAQAELGGARGLELELAQLRAAMGLWDLAAQAWRTAVQTYPYLERAALFSLTPTPAATRGAVIEAFTAQPVAVGARRIAAALSLDWGSPRDGWDVLRGLRPDSAALAAWTDYAERAEDAQAWLVARDALAAVFKLTGSPDIALRAANDAMNGGDARSALALAGAIADSSGAALAALPVRLRALTALGRADEAERELMEARSRVSGEQHARLLRVVAWGWVRSGEVARARTLLGDDPDNDDPVYGWLALYEGDLQAARRLLKSHGDATPDLVTALALLARTRESRAPAVGRAFLLLARADTAGAAAAMEASSADVPDAASLLLTTAARLYASRRDDSSAVALWAIVIERYAEAPEAPEAALEWARSLRRTGQTAAAIERLENLLLTYPQSALLPQARRELELARANIPPTP